MILNGARLNGGGSRYHNGSRRGTTRNTAQNRGCVHRDAICKSSGKLSQSCIIKEYGRYDEPCWLVLEGFWLVRHQKCSRFCLGESTITSWWLCRFRHSSETTSALSVDCKYLGNRGIHQNGRTRVQGNKEMVFWLWLTIATLCGSESGDSQFSPLCGDIMVMPPLYVRWNGFN